MKYDYIIVGSGLFGSICAYELKKKNKKVLVIEKRNHVGGNIFTENVHGINVHTYGAHIFHTSNKKVWDYINKFAEFNTFINSPLANYHGEIYHMPFNMNTFHELWGINTPDEAKAKIAEEVAKENIKEPKNLEEQALSMVGRTIYIKLVKEYTEKQWGRDCKELPAFIIKRLPLRFEYNNNYFNDIYQGIPVGGYTQIIQKMLNGVEVMLNTNFLSKKDYFLNNTKKVIYTGSIDELYDYCFGVLEYRTVYFKQECLQKSNFQNNAVVNYTSNDVPYTRIIEHKHFEFGKQDFTIISKEFSGRWEKGLDRFYPINDQRNDDLYKKYFELSKSNNKLVIGGRLGFYKYMDMDKIIESALSLVQNLV